MSAPFFAIEQAASIEDLFDVLCDYYFEHRSKLNAPCNGDDEFRFSIVWGFLQRLPIEPPPGRDAPKFPPNMPESLAALYRAKYLAAAIGTHFSCRSRGRFRPKTRAVLEVVELTLLALGQLARRFRRPSELESIDLSQCSKRIEAFYRREQRELWSRCCLGQLCLFDLVA